MTALHGASTLDEAIRQGREVYQALRQILLSSNLSAAVGADTELARVGEEARFAGFDAFVRHSQLPSRKLWKDKQTYHKYPSLMKVWPIITVSKPISEIYVLGGRRLKTSARI